MGIKVWCDRCGAEEEYKKQGNIVMLPAKKNDCMPIAIGNSLIRDLCPKCRRELKELKDKLDAIKEQTLVKWFKEGKK